MSGKVVFTNANIYTMDRRSVGAQAIAVEDGKIREIGAVSSVRPLRRRGFSIIDLKKHVVIPGLIDSHLHLLSLGNSFKRVNLDGIDSLAKAKEIIKGAASLITKGRWLMGRGWNKNLWGDSFPDKKTLDSITDGPAALRSKDGHLLWVNSIALNLAEIDRSTPDPAGGVIERDPGGEPTGILKEDAVDIVDHVIPPATYEDKKESIRQAQKHLLSLGVTGVGDCDGDADLLGIYEELDAGKRLKLRLFKMISRSNFEAALNSGFRTGSGSEHLRIGCLKIFADGALGSQTALMFEPYDNLAVSYGVEVLAQKEIEDFARRAVEAGISVAIHAIGDRANFQALSGIGKYAVEFKDRRLRPRIEHAQVLRKTDIVLFNRYAIVPSVQPIHATSDRDIADRYWGARCRYAYPFRTLLSLGARLAFGSDAPIETADPMAGIHAASTRKRKEERRPAWYPDERITARQAVDAYTNGSSYACCYDDIAGSLAVGKCADFVVLSDDIFKSRPEKIAQTKVVMTVIDGKAVYGSI